ncbi:serine/threonine protein kinase [Streptomyces sp. NPDC087859]|uniref:serine/threonine protein kinase n=1 Tax=Streptomyces sp. NPDC087859 TaxID=3365812 RepID=UPI00381978BA
MRHVLRAVVAICAALGISLAFTGSAQAASNPVTVCGSGYYVQSSHELGLYLETGGPQAIVYLLYNSSTGYNCAVTVVTGEQIGNPVNVGIRAEGGTWLKDPGNYNSYAGPVRVKAAGKCVQYMGSTRWWSSSSPYTDTYTSPLGWCG